MLTGPRAKLRACFPREVSRQVPEGRPAGQGGRRALFALLQAVTVCDRQDCVEQLLRNMFDGDQTESCLVSGTQVLLTLLEARRAG